MIWYDIIFTIK